MIESILYHWCYELPYATNFANFYAMDYQELNTNPNAISAGLPMIPFYRDPERIFLKR